VTVRAIRIALLVALALAVSGCGAQEQSAASGGAELVSATAPIFVSIDSNLSSDQWQQVDELFRKFPIRSEALASLRSSLEDETGLDYEQDVKPALGDEIDLVWLDFANDGSNAVALTKPKDAAAFRRMIEKGNAKDNGEDPLLFEEMDGWFVLSDTQQKIDRFQAESEGDKLSDDEVFKDALAELPDDALVHVFARGRSIVEALQDLPEMTFQLGADQKPEFLSAALAAEGSGIRLVGAGRVEEEPKAPIEPFESKLLGDVPADAVAFLTFRGGEEFEQQMEKLQREGDFGPDLDEFERMLGFRLADLLDVLSHEVGLYVRPGTPLPEVTVLVDAPDEQEVLRRVNLTLRALTKDLPTQPCHAPEEAGVPVTCIDLGVVQLRTAGFDDKVVVTIGQDAISKLRGDGPRLNDDEGFKSAQDAAGLPDETVGFMWLDLEDGLPLILGLAEAAGESIPADIRANLEPLGSFLAWGEADGRSGSFTAFLQID
jgi:Protein of unknown function (DUF3352)